MLVLCAASAIPTSASAKTMVLQGRFTCNDGQPLSGVRVELLHIKSRLLPEVWPNQTVANAAHAGADGGWSWRVTGGETNWRIRAVLVNGDVGLKDFPTPWHHYADTLRTQNNRPLADYGTQVVPGAECRLWNAYRQAADGFRADTGGGNPAGATTVLENAPTAGVPVTPYTDTYWPAGFSEMENIGTKDAPVIRSVAQHEFAHSVRHALDGDKAHFLYDAARFWYLRNHSGSKCESTNHGFAFNEGWAEYWADEVRPSPCGDGKDYSIERNVAYGLKLLQRTCKGVTRGRMVQVLAQHRGGIHSMSDFSNALGCVPLKPIKITGKAKRSKAAVSALVAARLVAGRRWLKSASSAIGRARSVLAGAKGAWPRALASGRLAGALALRKTFSYLSSRASQRRIARRSDAAQIGLVSGKQSAYVRKLRAILSRTLQKGVAIFKRQHNRAAAALLGRARSNVAGGHLDALQVLAQPPTAPLHKTGPTPPPPPGPPPSPSPSPNPLAPPGDLDPSFSADGKQTVNFGGGDRATHLALAPDGRIVVVGYTDATGGGDIAVARVGSDGAPDGGFGSGGRVTLGTPGNAFDVGAGVVVLADQRIVVAAQGGAGQDFVAKRLNADGSLDASFGTAGTATVNFGGNETVNQMIAQPDGKLVLVGSTSVGGDFAILRLNADGTPDASFSGDGQQTVDFGGADEAIAVANAPGGKLVVAGKGGPGGDMAVTRLSSDGSVDTSFATAGKAVVDFGGAEVANGVAVQPDGKVVLDGTTDAIGSGDFAVARLDVGGSLDPTFSGDGKTTFFGAAEAHELGLALAIQGNGKILVFGQGDSGDFIVTRLAADGTLDTGFGAGGRVGVDFGGTEFDGDIALQRDGRIVMVGSTTRAGDASDIAIARLNGDPTAP